MPITLQAGPLWYPVSYWWPLALWLLVAQALSVALLLRPSRPDWRRVAGALLVADIVLIAVLRVCVGQMGRLDYSASFTTWRWWFLAAGITLLALPFPLWVLALRWSTTNQARAGTRSFFSPRFGTVLLMWVLTGIGTFALGADVTYWPRLAQVTHVEATIPNLPRELDGLRVTVLADLHTGELVTPEVLQKRLLPLQQVKPDLLLLLGDITYLDPTYQRKAALLVQPYVIPARTFAVAGNMDSGAGTDSLREELSKVGIRFLENESVTMPIRGKKLVIAGLGDTWTGEGDLPLTLAHVPSQTPIILLSHSPDIIPEAMARDIPLVLSGHTHGGQIVFPFAGPTVGMSRFGTRFTAGKWTLKRTTLVVSRGLGEESLPLRLFCPPEILVITLHARK